MVGKKKNSDGKKKPNIKKSGLGFALWVIAALVILVFFIVNQNTIANNLKATGFFNKTGLKTPEFVEKAEPDNPLPANKNEVEPIGPVEIDLNETSYSSPTKTASVTPKNSSAKTMQETVTEEKAEKVSNSEINKAENKTEEEKNAESKAEPKTDSKAAVEQKEQKKEKKESIVKKEISVATEPKATMKLKLYFATINSNGTVARKEVTREMKKSDSPLVDSINAIIIGPNAEEEKKGYFTAIPYGTKLIGASVKNGTATLNFSGDFEFNGYGVQGLQTQIQQIVYTATAFPTVERVQFLIDGEKREYLGADGLILIGFPLSRNNVM